MVTFKRWQLAAVASAVIVSMANIRLASADPTLRDFDWSRLPQLTVFHPIVTPTGPITVDFRTDKRAIASVFAHKAPQKDSSSANQKTDRKKKGKSGSTTGVDVRDRVREAVMAGLQYHLISSPKLTMPPLIVKPAGPIIINLELDVKAIAAMFAKKEPPKDSSSANQKADPKKKGGSESTTGVGDAGHMREALTAELKYQLPKVETVGGREAGHVILLNSANRDDVLKAFQKALK